MLLRISHILCSFEVKLTFEMVTVRQHLFWIHDHIFLWNCRRFWDKNASIWGELETFGFMSNALTIWVLSGPDICSPMFWNTGSGGIDIFVVKLPFAMLTVRRATSFIFGSRTDVLVKVSKFLREKIYYTEEDLIIHWCFNLQVW